MIYGKDPKGFNWVKKKTLEERVDAIVNGDSKPEFSSDIVKRLKTND